jgi:flavodoxin
MARAAIEADLVERSFDRLVHRDRKYAYEAFALVTLLIRAGETEVVAEHLQKTTDSKVRRAILHTIKVSKNKHGLEALKSILAKKNLSPELQEDVDKTIEEMGFVTV